MDEELRTRLLGAEDWALWRAVRLRALAESPDAFGATYAEELAFSQERWESWLSSDEPQVAVFDGHDSTAPVAVGAGYREDPDRLHVIAMWTAPEHRGRRLAAHVLDALADWAAPRDLVLVLDVAIGNAAARSAYTAYGFTPTGEARPIRAGSPDLVETLVLEQPRALRRG